MGPGGFYQPGYRDGAKLFLKMMCLGKNWDPNTGKYDDTRPTDQAKAPPIPDEFQRLVKEAIQKCHFYLESDCKGTDPSKLLPLMSPNICIINFYSSSGKLGLHQVCIFISLLIFGDENFVIEDLFHLFNLTILYFPCF